MLIILQVRLQQYLNCELLDVQAGFRRGRGTRDQIANIRWIIEKAREYQLSGPVPGVFLLQKPVIEKTTTIIGELENSGSLCRRAQRS